MKQEARRNIKLRTTGNVFGKLSLAWVILSLALLLAACGSPTEEALSITPTIGANILPFSNLTPAVATIQPATAVAVATTTTTLLPGLPTVTPQPKPATTSVPTTTAPPATTNVPDTQLTTTVPTTTAPPLQHPTANHCATTDKYARAANNDRCVHADKYADTANHDHCTADKYARAANDYDHRTNYYYSCTRSHYSQRRAKLWLVTRLVGCEPRCWTYPLQRQ